MQNDDLYVTGSLGDSYIGLKVLKKKIKLSKSQNKYFINKYYKPELHLKLGNQLKDSYKKNITKFMRDMISLVKKMK